jgi:hypothetical protein
VCEPHHLCLGAAGERTDAIPSAEAYYADNGSYTGLTIPKLREYDRQVATPVQVGYANAQTYCLEATVGAATYSTTRGDNPIANGNVVAGPC